MGGTLNCVGQARGTLRVIGGDRNENVWKSHLPYTVIIILTLWLDFFVLFFEIFLESLLWLTAVCNAGN